MKHYIAKADLGNCFVDVFIMSDGNPVTIKDEILRNGGLEGPMGWVSSTCLIAVLDCAAMGVKPPVGGEVIPFKLVGGKDANTRGSGEGQAPGLPQEPGA